MREPCKSVLVVEDNEDIRAAIEDLLRFENYPVQSAENGKQALDLLKQAARPCLILLDLMMPIMNGWEFLENIRRDDILITIPIVLLTAVDDSGLKNVHGVKGIMKKPVKLELLLESVQKYCTLSAAA